MTVKVAGETPSNFNSGKLGEFIRQVGREKNGAQKERMDGVCDVWEGCHES